MSNFGNFAIAYISPNIQTKELDPKCSLFDACGFFLFKFNLFLLTPSCKCNLECLYTRVYSWSLWYQIIQLSSQIYFFSFSLLQKFHPKTFKTLSNGGLYDQLECHDQTVDISCKAKDQLFLEKPSSLSRGLNSKVWVITVKGKTKFHWNPKEKYIVQDINGNTIQNVDEYRILLLLKRWGFISNVVYRPVAGF